MKKNQQNKKKTNNPKMKPKSHAYIYEKYIDKIV